jgi:hypothetical protein
MLLRDGLGYLLFPPVRTWRPDTGDPPAPVRIVLVVSSVRCMWKKARMPTITSWAVRITVTVG